MAMKMSEAEGQEQIWCEEQSSPSWPLQTSHQVERESKFSILAYNAILEPSAHSIN
jgi:hypothetical protein